VIQSRPAGWSILGVVLLLLGINATALLQNCQNLRPVHQGELAPNFQLPRVEDGKLAQNLSLKDTRGKLVLLDFWATWCAPCRASLPILEEVARTYPDDLQVLSINIEGANAAGRAHSMLSRLAPSITLLSDTNHVSSLYNVSTIPYLLLLDRNGRVVWVHRGGLRASSLHKAIASLL